MRYRLITVVYAFALLAAAMAVAASGGPEWSFTGIIVAGLILSFWAWLYRTPADQPIRKRAIVGVLAAVAVTVSGSILLMGLCTALSNIPLWHADMRCEHLSRALAADLAAFYVDHDEFPPIVSSADAAPPQSWRVALLPYLDSEKTRSPVQADRYDATKAWDSSGNVAAAALVPQEYRCCAAQFDGRDEQPDETHFFRIHARDDPTRDAFEVPLVIEAASLGVTWTEPRDVSLDEAIDLLTVRDDAPHVHTFDDFFRRGRSMPPNRIVARCAPAAADQRSVLVGQFANRDDALAFLTALAAGETTDALLAKQRPSIAEWETQWGRVYGAIVFACVALLPGVVLWRRRRRLVIVE